MAFEPLNLQPVGRNPTAGTNVWYYVTTVDDIATIETAGYFTSEETGITVGDIILAIATDGVELLGVTAIDNDEVEVFGTLIDLDDITHDGTNDPIEPDIGGTIVPETLRRALERIHQRLNLKVQRGQNVGSGTSVFEGTDDGDPSARTLNFRQIAVTSGLTIDLINNTVVIGVDEDVLTTFVEDIVNDTGGSGTGGGGGGTGGTNGSLIPDPPGDFGFTNGGRLLYVTKNGSDPIGGETADQKFTSIQAALNAAVSNDVILVKTDVYREFPITADDVNDVWLVAEERGGARISALFEAADEGTASWTSDGNGVFFTSRSSRPYIGSHGDDFLMLYLDEADLRATSVSGVTKPERGIAFVSSESRIYVRLRNSQNPNGQSVKITANISQLIMDFDDCDNFVLDGFVIEGSGNNQAVDFDSACSNPIIRNCVFTHCRFGARFNGSGGTFRACEFKTTGFGDWCAEVLDLDGKNNNGPFTLAKNYYNASAVGQSGGTGNALLEGSLDVGAFNTTPDNNMLMELCLIGPCFDGSNLGRYSNSEIKECVFIQCRDDGVQMEGSGSSQTGANNEVHDCRFVDCFVGTSHQSETTGPNYVYRNVFENRDSRFRHNTHYFLKMLRSEDNLELHHYHNLYINISDSGATNQFVWYDFSNGTADTIERFFNNIIIYPGELSSGAGPNPQTISNNAVVAPSSSDASVFTANSGVFAGTTESDMELDDDLALTTDSPAVGIGRSLPSGLPDTGSSNDDAGPFPLGESPGLNWPREQTTTFDLNPPDAFA